MCLCTLAALTNQSVAQTDLELIQLIAKGQVDEARRLYETLSPNELDWLFFKARVAKANRRFEEAIVGFRLVLRRDPTYMAAQRELAHSLLLIEDYRAATRHFQDLLKNDPDLDQRRGYVHFLNEIDREQPFLLSGTIAIVSSSNINRGSAHDTFHPGVPDTPSFDITSRAESDTGLEFSLNGRHLWSTQGNDQWRLDWGFSTRQFRGSQHDSYDLSTRISFNRINERTRWSIGPTARHVWAPKEDDHIVFGLSGSWEQRVSTRRSLFFAGSAENRNFESSKTKDGPFYWAQAGVATQSLGGVLAVGARASFHRPKIRHQQYDGQAVFAQLSRTWPGGLKGAIGFELGRREYKADFPLAGAARDDSYYQLSVTAQHDAIRIGRYTPTVHCLLRSTSSNIAFYDHDISECTYSIAMRF